MRKIDLIDSIDEIKELYLQGKTTCNIASYFYVTKNLMDGFIKEYIKGVKPKEKRVRKTYPIPPYDYRKEPKFKVVGISEPEYEKFETFNKGQCKYLKGHGKSEWQICTADALRGKPYCDFHNEALHIKK